MSGTTFQWSTPQSLPVRPMPVWISSAMSSAPYVVQSSRARGEIVVGRHDAARLTLHRLQHHAGDLRTDRIAAPKPSSSAAASP